MGLTSRLQTCISFVDADALSLLAFKHNNQTLNTNTKP